MNSFAGVPTRRAARRLLAASILLAALSGCAGLHRELQLDERSGLYPTEVDVDPGGVLSFDTTVDPKSFPIVLLAAGTPVRPAGFEFTVRSALAQLGLTRVYNVGEFRRLAHDLRFAGADDTVNAALVRRFSQEIAPVLVVEATNIPFGEARMRFDLRVIDGRDAKILLNVNHPRFIWVDHDAEVLRPVLNQLRRWARASAKRAA